MGIGIDSVENSLNACKPGLRCGIKCGSMQSDLRHHFTFFAKVSCGIAEEGSVWLVAKAEVWLALKRPELKISEICRISSLESVFGR